MVDSLLPDNATEAELAIEQSTARIVSAGAPLRPLWNPETCPAELLPWLAWALSVDDWDSGWPLEVKRQVVAASIDVHRHKGSRGSILRALAAMGYGEAVITEGWQTMVGGPWVVGDSMRVGGAGHWAEYWITIHAAITPAMVDAIAARLASVAPVRCRLTRIIVDAVTVVVGGPWAVGDSAVTVGATYPMEVI